MILILSLIFLLRFVVLFSLFIAFNVIGNVGGFYYIVSIPNLTDVASVTTLRYGFFCFSFVILYFIELFCSLFFVCAVM